LWRKTPRAAEGAPMRKSQRARRRRPVGARINASPNQPPIAENNKKPQRMHAGVF